MLKAGMRPNRTPVKTDTASVKRSTRQSRVTAAPFSPMRGMSPGFSESRIRTPTVPRRMPNTPPVSERRILSVSSWRIIRPLPAPSAARTAISRFRAVARISKRFATFAQAISKTKPTAITNTHNDERTSPIIASRNGCTAKPSCASSTPGYFRRNSSAESLS